MRKTNLLSLLLLFSVLTCSAQTDTEFWFVAPNVDGNNANFNLPIVFRLTSFASAATVTISLPADPSFAPVTVTLAATSTQTVDLSAWVSQLQNAPANTILNKGILIRSTANITAYYEVVSSYCSCNPEIFALKGKNALGTEFYISSQYTYSIDTVRQPAATTSFDIVATVDNTTISITPTKDIVGHPANVPFTIVLNRGQTWSATGIYRDLNHHLQGSYVVADKPIAVTLKDDLVWGDGTCADLIGDQTIPTTVLGNEYIVSKGYLQPRDRVFVLAVQDNTSIFLDGSSSPAVLLSKGQSWTFDLTNSSTYITGDKKFYVYHVTGTGCELGSAIIPKLNCTGSTNISIVRSSNDQFGVMLVTKNGNQNAFSVNGNTTVIPAASFNPVPGTAGAYVAATVDLSGFIPAGGVLNFGNTSGVFQMGFLNGAAIGGSRYGFFSDFKTSTVSTSEIDICANGSAQLNAVGGVSYSWSPAAGLSDPNIANPVASPAVTTTYRVLITDAAGCVDSAFVTVNLSTVPVDFVFDENICNPMQVSLSGRAPGGYTYTWLADGTPLTPGQQTSYTFPQPGIYTIVLDATSTAGCVSRISKDIGVHVQPAEIVQTPDTGICAGGSAVLRTKAALDFCWSPTTGLNDPSSANPVASPSATTKYHFTAKTTGANLMVNGDFEGGNTGFSSAYTYMVSGLPQGVYFVGTDPHTWNPGAPIGCGDHTSGHGKMMIINGATVTGVNVWTAGPFAVTPNTDYAFSIWIESVSPLAPAILQFSINGAPLGNTVNASPATCVWNQFYTTWNSGSNTTATIALLNNNTNFAGNDFALDDISFAPVTVQTDSVTVDVEIPSVNVSPTAAAVCPGIPVQLQASGSLNYSWLPATGLSNAEVADPVALLPDAGATLSYTVTGTSARGCVATATADLSVYPKLLSVGAGMLICRGDAAPLQASGGNTYSWSPPGVLDDPFSSVPLARPDTTTRFVVTSVDANSCTEKDSMTVSVKPVPVFHAPDDERVCKGFEVALKSSNPAGYRYSWSPGATLDDPSAPTPIAAPEINTLYTLDISDSLCPAYDSTFTLAVTVLANPVVTAEKGNDIDCAIHLAPLHATGGFSYVWTPTAGLDDPRSPDPVATIDSTTTYIVKGTGANGCYAYDTLTVKVTATGANTFVIPNAFTPNGDGHNDCFGIKRWGDIRLEEMEIFNRWGLRVFSTRNASECWDGTFRGRPQEAGAYVYVIKAHTFCGEITRTGTVLLIR